METGKEESKFRRSLVAVGALGLVALIGGHYMPPQWALGRDLAISIGESLFVAAILGFTVDKYIKEFLVREASKDLFKYLVGYKLPEEIQNRLRDLMGTSLIRRNYQVTYTLSATANDQMLLDVKYSFLVENVSTDEVDYTPKFQGEKHDKPRILELRCDGKDIRFRKAAESGGTIGEESTKTPGVIEAVGPEISLKPGRVYPISGHYQLQVPPNHSDTLSFLYPTVDVTVRTECPEGFEFVIEGAELETPNMWQFGGHAFLTNEHTRVRWFKRPPKEPVQRPQIDR